MFQFVLQVQLYPTIVTVFAKRRRTGYVTPATSRRLLSGSVDGSLHRSSSGSVVSSLSGSSTIASPTILFRESMPLDDDVVPPHRTITPSVTMPLLKRLLPDDIARLSAGEFIIIVIPPTSKATSSVLHGRRHYYSMAFDRVIEASYAWVRNSRDRARYIDKCSRSHHVQRDGAIAFQYHVRVSNYAERALFEMESPDKSQIDLVWSQGAGINVVVCKYSRTRSVLLQLKDIAFLEVHRLTSPVGDENDTNHSCLNSRIEFPKASRPENLVRPFLGLIEAVRGCRFSTIETLWKYYRAECLATRRQANLQAGVDRERALSTERALSDATALASTRLTSGFSGDVTYKHFRGIRNELTYANITAFSVMVDDLYRHGLE